MAFTKQHKAKNEAIATAAAAHLAGIGYPASGEHEAARSSLEAAIKNKFPELSRDRLRNRCAKALRVARGVYVKKRGAPLGSRNAAKGGVTLAIRAYVADEETAVKIRALSSDERGRILSDAIKAADSGEGE